MSASSMASVAPPATASPPPRESSAPRFTSPGAQSIPLPPTHRVSTVLGALGGLAALGAVTTLGSGSLHVVAPGTFVLLASLLGGVVLTAPALLALHQFLQLAARPEAMVLALAHALVVGGRLALGLAPVGLFFAATTSHWPVVLLAGFALCGVTTAAVAMSSLRAVESRAAESASGWVAPRFHALVSGWSILTTLIALRIGFDVLTLVFERGLR